MFPTSATSQTDIPLSIIRWVPVLQERHGIRRKTILLEDTATEQSLRGEHLD